MSDDDYVARQVDCSFSSEFVVCCLEIQYNVGLHTMLSVVVFLSWIFPSAFSAEFWIICFYNCIIFTSWFWKDTHVINPLYKQASLRVWRQLLEQCAGLWCYMSNSSLYPFPRTQWNRSVTYSEYDLFPYFAVYNRNLTIKCVGLCYIIYCHVELIPWLYFIKFFQVHEPGNCGVSLCGI